LLHGHCAVHPANCTLAGYKRVSAYACALVCLYVCVYLFISLLPRIGTLKMKYLKTHDSNKMALCLHPATMTKFQYNNWLKLSFKLPFMSTILIQIQNSAFVYILAIMSIYHEFNSGCTAHLFFLFQKSSENNIPLQPLQLAWQMHCVSL
jgi:hypothetical protein